MNWLVKIFIFKWINNKLEGLMGSGWMAKIAALATMIGGAAGILTGIGCALTALSNGTLADHYKDCLALVVAGAAVFSPGVHAMKVGVFSRPS